MGLKALGDGAALLPHVTFERPQYPQATNTLEALQAGIYWGTLGQFHYMIDALQKHINYPSPLPIVVTGGMSRFFISELKGKIHYDPHLTLKGLALVGRMHQ
jgi:type III pantothenate kinase